MSRCPLVFASLHSTWFVLHILERVKSLYLLPGIAWIRLLFKEGCGAARYGKNLCMSFENRALPSYAWIWSLIMERCVSFLWFSLMIRCLPITCRVAANLGEYRAILQFLFNSVLAVFGDTFPNLVQCFSSRASLHVLSWSSCACMERIGALQIWREICLNILLMCRTDRIYHSVLPCGNIWDGAFICCPSCACISWYTLVMERK
jgi:hypothetical protein